MSLIAVIGATITALGGFISLLLWLAKNKKEKEEKRERKIDEVARKLQESAHSMDVADIRNRLRELHRLRKK